MVGRGHAAIEERLRNSGIKWVILRPGLFMQNVLTQAASIKNDSKMVLPFAKDLPVALTDVRDTGAVGARILIDPAPHAGKTYEFTGKLTSYGEFAEVFSQVLGRTIAYVGITAEQAEQGMKSRGMPDWLIAHLVTIAKLGAKGAFSTENTKLIHDLVKRAPITTKQFVEDHKALFACSKACVRSKAGTQLFARCRWISRFAGMQRMKAYANPLARAWSRAITAQSCSPSPWATAPTRRSRQTLPLGSGTPAASPAASARFASLSPLTARWPAGRYCSSAMNLP